MAWWAWLLLGWVLVATTLAFWLGAVAHRIKQAEKREQQLPEDHSRHQQAS